MVSRSLAAVQVEEWLERSHRSRSWLANKLGVKRESLWRWLNGRRTPGIAYCVAIERLTGVPAESWVVEGGDYEKTQGGL